MKYYFYIIFSEKLNRYYAGHTENMEKRILEHNSGISSYTSKANDWILKHFEEYPSREAARKREMSIKKKKSRTFIEALINSVKS